MKDGHLAFLKKRWPLIILFLILVLGFYLRAYHIDYPVIGYHNMKEAHTLTEMRNMHEKGDYLVNERDYYKPNVDQPYGIHGDNFPLFAWSVVFLWKIFGVKLWLARLAAILFSLGTVVFVYSFIKLIFKRNDLALLSAFFTAVMPILIFFGRQVQYDIVALFFMTGSIYFFWLWRKRPKIRYFIPLCLFIVLAGLSKYPFLIVLFPVALSFPWKRINYKKEFFQKNWKQFLWTLPFITFFVFWWFFSKSLNAHGRVVNVRFFSLERLGLFFSSEMWSAIWNYAATDNFTFIGLILAFFGFLLVLKKFKKPNYRFLAVWGLSYFIYAAMAPPQMKGHNYYQLPFAPLIGILIAYFLIFAANSISSFSKHKYLKPALKWGSILIVLLIMLPSLKLSTTRQFDTQFYGLDLAGGYIKQNSRPNEWILGSGHQDTGIAWHAHRKMIDGAPQNLSKLKEYEEELNIQWIFAYQWGINRYLNNPELAEYISDNYSLKQFAFLKQGDQNQPIYFLFEKGGQTNLTNLNQILSDHPVNFREYELTRGKVVLNYINL